MYPHVLCILLLAGLCWSASANADSDPMDTSDAASLGAYRALGQSLQIPGVTENSSGLTYSSKTKSLFVVIDSPASIVEFTPGGGKKRKINLRGFDGPEGITYIGTILSP